MFVRSAALAAVLIAGWAVSAEARDQIRIVGSSTVFPFATAVAEEFGKTSSFKTPIVESTGTGGGLKLFCAGVGIDHTDIANASRRIESSEIETCAENGVTEIVEVKIGFDGIVVANSRAAGGIDLSLRQLYLALAKDVPVGGQIVANPYEKWSELGAGLPDIPIAVFGPPPTSGTRDAFVELAMDGGCKGIAELDALKESDVTRHKAVCQTLREDGAFIEAGENDNLIVQKLAADPNAFGIVGYSFLDQNIDTIQGSRIAGAEPTFDAIAAGTYPLSRPLFFYVKKAHLGLVPGIAEYLAEFTSDKAMGEEGYLADKGLIPLPDDQRNQSRESATLMTPLSM